MALYWIVGIVLLLGSAFLFVKLLRGSIPIETFTTVLIACIAVVVLLAFTASICVAAYYSLWSANHPEPDKMPTIASYALSTINGILAANLGAAFGVSLAVRNRRTFTVKLQWFAVFWYLLTIAVAFFLWSRTNPMFTDSPTGVVPGLPEVCRTGLGMLIAILAAALGIKGSQILKEDRATQGTARSGG